MNKAKGGSRVQGLNELQVWRQRREELLREAEINRLARATRTDRKERLQENPALDWELQRYGGRISKLFHALIQAL